MYVCMIHVYKKIVIYVLNVVFITIPVYNMFMSVRGIVL